MHVISDLNFGGAGKYLQNICKYIDKEQFEVTVILPERSVLNDKIKAIENVALYNVRGIDNKSFDVNAVKEIRSLIKRIEPDIVHSHACLSARIAAYKEKTPKVFYTRHCIQPKDSFLKRTVKTTINRVLSDKVIAVSKSIYDNLIDEGEKRENIYVIYNGVEILSETHDVEALKDKYSLKREHAVITLVGRLEEVKGQMHMLNISKQMLEKTSGFDILFVGEGSNRGELEERIRREKLPVKMIGHVDEIDEIYALSDIIVNTSNSEALSFAVIEGFSHKKPAVAFNIEGLKEVVDNDTNGYLVEFGDYKSFADRLCKLMQSESLREEFGKNGFEKAKQKFSIENMIKELENTYMEE